MSSIIEDHQFAHNTIQELAEHILGQVLDRSAQIKAGQHIDVVFGDDMKTLLDLWNELGEPKYAQQLQAHFLRAEAGSEKEDSTGPDTIRFFCDRPKPSALN